MLCSIDLGRRAAGVGRRDDDDERVAFDDDVADDAEIDDRDDRHLGIADAFEHRPGAGGAPGTALLRVDAAREHDADLAHHTPPGYARCRYCISAST